MRFNHPSLIFWYALTQGVAIAALTFAYQSVVLSLLAGIISGSVSFLSLNTSGNYNDDNSPYITTSETIAKFGIVLFIPLIFLANIVIALLVFIAIAQHALNLQTHDYRRFYLGCMISFIIICGGAVQTKSGAYLVYFLLYTASNCILLGHAYIAKNSNASTQLWHHLEKVKMASVVISLAFVIYLLNPRFAAGNLGAQPNSEHFYQNKDWQQQAEKKKDLPLKHQLDELSKTESNGDVSGHSDSNNQGSSSNNAEQGSQQQSNDEGDFSYSGFDDSLDINEPDPKNSRMSNHLLAYVRSDTPLYLRAQIFDSFDGKQWHKSKSSDIKIDMPRMGKQLNDRASENQQSYEVNVETYLGDYIALAATPSKLSFPSTAVAIDQYGQIKSPSTLLKGTSYSATSNFEFIQQRAFSQDLQKSTVDYLQLPEDLDSRIIELSQQVSGSYKSQFDKALALEKHLRENYQYSLSSVYQSQKNTPLDEFLFESKKGHCEYFASALSIMLRSIDIPSRLVTGFSASQQNPLTGYYEVYALDAHAWVEAYVDELGWVLLEPTAFYSGLLPEKTKLSAEKIDEYIKHVEAMQKGTGKKAEVNLKNILIAIWLELSLLVTVVLSYAKLYALKFSPYILSIIAFGFLLHFSWHKYKRAYLAYRLNKKVLSTQFKSNKDELSFYLNAIDELLHLADIIRPRGLSIESWIKIFLEKKLITNHQLFSLHFNQLNYANNISELDIEMYKKLFIKLYELELSQLKPFFISHK